MSYKHHAITAPDVTIRYAFPDDTPAIAALAAVDSQAVPEGVLLVAEVGGELWAAISLSAKASIADPFRPTADVCALLEARAAQLRRGAGKAGFESLFEPAAWLRAALADG
jgi:hypothetical protein